MSRSISEPALKTFEDSLICLFIGDLLSLQKLLSFPPRPLTLELVIHSLFGMVDSVRYKFYLVDQALSPNRKCVICPITFVPLL